MQKANIDVEALLSWAYRDQCVDRQVHSARPKAPVSPSGSLGQYVALGTRVDCASTAVRALGVRLPDDAMTVHDAVLRLSGFWIEWDGTDSVEIWDRERLEAEGLGIIEEHGAHWLCGADYEALRRVENAHVTALVIGHARAGSRPDWHEGWVAPVGAPVRRPGRARARGEAADRAEVAHARALYAVWRAALAVLAADLDGALTAHDVTGPAAPAEPWAHARVVRPALSSVAAFAAARLCLTGQPGDVVPVVVACRAYRAWCAGAGLRPVPDAAFVRAMGAAGAVRRSGGREFLAAAHAGKGLALVDSPGEAAA